MLNGAAKPRLVKAPSVHKKWISPACGALKINVDGAFLHESGKAAIGVIIRDHEGHALLTAWRILVHCRDAEEAEAAACREGIVMVAGSWPELPMVVETDCAVIAEKLKSKEKDRSVAWSIMHEAQLAVEDLHSLEVVKVSRSQNNVAPEVAHYALRSGSSQVFFCFFPKFVQSLVCNDKL